MNRTLFPVIVFSLFASASAVGASIFDGKSGAALMEAVREGYSPKNFVTRYDGPAGLWEVLKVTDSRPDGTGYMNRFSEAEISYGFNGGAPGNLELVYVASPQWWEASDSYTGVSQDIYNHLPGPAGVNARKGSFVPGEVDGEPEPGLFWSVGRGSVGATRVNLWEPPQELKGDVARIMMYVAAVYPSYLLRYETAAGAVWADEPSAGFTSAYAAQLMVWHRADPPSDYERLRNRTFSSLQGNVNPFVEYPDLAEYLFGEHKGEAYGSGSGDNPPDDNPDDDDDNNVDKSPLRGEYSLSDSRINLSTPYVPADARWSIDGVAVEKPWLVPAEIGAGEHELHFEADGLHGCVKIVVR